MMTVVVFQHLQFDFGARYNVVAGNPQVSMFFLVCRYIAEEIIPLGNAAPIKGKANLLQLCNPLFMTLDQGRLAQVIFFCTFSELESLRVCLIERIAANNA
jgi:hypothetical protein